MRSLVDRRLRIAHAGGLPVCDDYEPPFAFSGHVHRVDVYIDTPPAPAEPAALDAKQLLND
jgi:hypothetical protein